MSEPKKYDKKKLGAALAAAAGVIAVAAAYIGEPIPVDCAEDCPCECAEVEADATPEPDAEPAK